MIRWRTGSSAVQQAAERGLAALAVDPSGADASSEKSPQCTLLRDNARRRVLVWRDPHCEPLLIKHFKGASGRHALREHFKRIIGYSPASREFRHLETLARHKVAVPAPLAFGKLDNGDEVLVLPFLEGCTLNELPPGTPWRKVLPEVGASVAQMHAVGLVHRDLHASNILITEDGPVLLDVQRAKSSRSLKAQRADIGALDSALARNLPLSQRMRMREAALGFSRPWNASAREAIKQVSQAKQEHLWDYARGRTRRTLIPGRRFARFSFDGGRGLRLRDLEEKVATQAMREHAAALGDRDTRVIKQEGRSRVTRVCVEGRSFIVKEIVDPSWGKRLVNLLRGAPAKRGWVGGHGLLIRGLLAPEPQAYLVRRRLGLPASSLLLLEDIASGRNVHFITSEEVDLSETLTVLGTMICSLHEQGVDHGDVKAGNLLLCGEPG
ncbi:MAG: hypothetical protein JRC77_05335, partial [Deltaproteobacteria bacterium]|nr:hypothetical protein [Deltaproteobacteria bacterium]